MSDGHPQFNCINCGYDLAAIRAARTEMLTCPECAVETDPYSLVAKRIRHRSNQQLGVLFLWIGSQAYLLGLFAGFMLLLGFAFYIFVLPALIPICIATDRALGKTVKQQRRAVAYILVLAWALGILLGITSLIVATHVF